MDQSIAPILFACLGNTSEAVKTERFACVSAEEWRSVAQLARQHSVAPLLYYHLQQMKMALPADVVKELKQAFRMNTLRMMLFSDAINKLLGLMHENDIGVIVLKGAYLAEVLYDKVGLRSMVDIDLLVKNDDLLRVDQELLALGCIPDDCNRVIAQDNHHFGYRLPGNDLRVEIHWTIINPSYSFRIDVDGLWRRAKPVILAKAPAWVLAPEDLLLHLCLHTASHTHEMRMSMLCDINQVVERLGAELNWLEIGARARQWGAVRAVYVILRLAQELLEVAVPADWLVSLRPDNFSERNLELIREQILFGRSGMGAEMHGSKYLKSLSQMWGTKGLRSKLVLLRERLLLPRETITRMYPVSVNSWRMIMYLPVRIKDVLVRYGPAFWRLLHSDPRERAITEYTNQIMALRDWLMSG